MRLTATFDHASPNEPSVALPRVMFVNMGKAPRDDVVPEILDLLDMPIQPLEIGVLDNLSSEQIEALSIAEGEQSLSTYLSKHIRIVLSKPAVTARVEEILQGFHPHEFDLVVILSTGLPRDFTCTCPMINAQRAVEAAILSLVSRDASIGLIHPLQRQVGEIDLPVLHRFSVSASHAKEGDRDSLARAVMDVADCDIIVLHSISYTEADREIVAKASRKPVILARRIIASSIRLMLQRVPMGPRNAVSPATQERLARLTPREREVLALVCEGLSNRAIAEELGISPKTVEVHRSHVMAKMEAPSLAALISAVLTGASMPSRG
ncbi:AroM family protein [Consotaella aegiceratis]|uniref:AroM family protein n=1 Tax=Consotaella aegiceratis TaxID=3097961 RepID=UPI002F401FBB